MTISHVIYLEFARLIVSWQWVTEVIAFMTWYRYRYNLKGDRNDRDREELVLALRQLRVQDDHSSGKSKIPWSEVQVRTTVQMGCTGTDIGGNVGYFLMMLSERVIRVLVIFW